MYLNIYWVNIINRYLGVRYNRARLIGVGELFIALSCFITASPYFIFGPATHFLRDESLLSRVASNRTNFEMCAIDGTDLDCANGKYATVWLAVVILFVGSFFRGIGFTVCTWLLPNLYIRIESSHYKIGILYNWFSICGWQCQQKKFPVVHGGNASYSTYRPSFR